MSLDSKARRIAVSIAGVGLALAAGWWLGRSSPGDVPHLAAAPAPPASAAPSSPPVPAAPAQPEEVRRAHQQAPADASPAVTAAIERLRGRLEASPGDLQARKELAVRLVEAGRLVEAFEQAVQVLAAAPDDPDGLYVQGEVRLAMGQALIAVELLDRVLAQHPDHLLALIAAGKAADRLGRKDQAVARWRRALAVAGGRYPPVEALLAGAGADGAAAPAAPAPLSTHGPLSR